ncbi:TetR/AcrR family transcriptional regulator [Aureimonas fodinaquatilis]|uniref:TetR/AcrR family transcriptional regulator n=1 Tax=Aureimonas fodinaquatilis TaxID=2565783 RepID=UPI001FE3BD9B|nr:TetR family transcriptional regulator [Aureimonas fodinaquatilis]
MATGPKRRHDPERRNRIIQAALNVVAEHGVDGTSHRRVAAEANVPLGSMTYHFNGMDDLLFTAFEQFTQSVAARFQDRLNAAQTVEEARSAVVDLICGDVWVSPRNMTLTFELYAYANRKPAVRSIMSKWMAGSRKALSRHFDAATSRALDMAIEGITIHNSVEVDSISRDEVARIIERLSRDQAG